MYLAAFLILFTLAPSGQIAITVRPKRSESMAAPWGLRNCHITLIFDARLRCGRRRHSIRRRPTLALLRPLLPWRLKAFNYLRGRPGPASLPTATVHRYV